MAENSEAATRAKFDSAPNELTKGADALRFEFLNSAAAEKLQLSSRIQDRSVDQKAIQPPPPWKPDPICNPPFDPFCKPDQDPFPWEPKPSKTTHQPKRHKHK